MPFTFDLPDPESYEVIDAVAPDGEVVRTVAPEIADALDATLAEQSQQLQQVIQAIAQGVQAQLTAQQQVLGSVWQGIARMVQRQLDSQRAALQLVWQRIDEYVTTRIAIINEQVGTTAVAAAMLPRQPAPYTPQQPDPTRPITPAPPAPFAPLRPLGTRPFTAPTAPPGAPPPPSMPTGGSNVPLQPQLLQVPEDPGTVQRVQAPTAARVQPQPLPYAPPAGSAPQPGTVGAAMAGAPATGIAGSAKPPTPEEARRILVEGEEEERQPLPLPPLEAPPDDLAPDVGDEGFDRIPPAEPEERRIVIDVEAEAEERLPRQAAPPEAQEKAPDKIECIWKLGDRLPVIGSAEWCRLQDAIARGFAALGHLALAVTLEPVDLVQAGLESAAAKVGLLDMAAPTNAFATFMQGVTRGALGMVRTMRQLIACWRELPKMAPQCNPEVLFGVLVFRAVVSSLTKIRLGTDAIAWATADLGLDFPQLERAARYIVESLCPSVIPSPHEAWRAYRAGFISEEMMRCWHLSAGVDPDLWEPVRRAEGPSLGAEQVILWARLSESPPGESDAALVQRGWERDVDRAVVQALYDRPPTGEQWLQWADVGALDEEVTRLLRRDFGFEPFWAGPGGQYARAHGMTEQEGLMRWRAQQPLPAYSELQTYLYRLRDDGPIHGRAVTRENVHAILLASDMVPAQVDWAMATLYRPLAPGDAAQVLRLTGRETGEVRNALLDAGYADEDARTVSTSILMESYRSRQSSLGAWTLDNAVSVIRAGLPLPAEALTLLDLQGYTDADVRLSVNVQALLEYAAGTRRNRMMTKRRAAGAALKAYSVGIIDADTAVGTLRASGYDAATAMGAVSAADLNAAAARAQHAIQYVRRGLLGGELSVAQARQTLATAGVTQATANNLTGAWLLEQAATRPMAQVGQIRKWVGEGLLSISAARARLRNMGWRDPDLTMMVSEMGQALAKAQATARKRGVAAQQATAKAADRIRQQALRRLERAQPVSALGAWYKEGVIGKEEVKARLKQYGYDSDSIALYLQGWDHQRAKRHASKTSVTPAKGLTPERQVPTSRIRQWYLDGIVDSDWARQRLASYGYDTDAIDGYLSQWDAQGQYRADRPKPPAPL